MAAADPRAAAFGAEVRRRRKEARLSQNDLALKMGGGVVVLRPGSYISRIEHAHKSPTLTTAWRLSDALGCDLTDLLRGPP